MFSSSPIINWRLYPQRYRLEGMQCARCNQKFYPKKYLCPCGSTNFQSVSLRHQATLLSFTQVTHAPREHKMYEPYCIGFVQLVDGPRIMTQLADVDFEELTVGMNLVAVLRKYYVSGANGIIHYGLKFVPESRA
ncbi:Zn-ribbon domain-containing OB-fold protein [Candidatus Babeliales bacterium]|nr:Zn-ribbon domain-containing OB-fold protein [Candidatus Babeliales bacterium]